MLSEEYLLKLAHIPTETIQKDMEDTRSEIDDSSKLLDIYRSRGRDYEVEIIREEVNTKERVAFIKKLNFILEWRKQQINHKKVN